MNHLQRCLAPLLIAGCIPAVAKPQSPPASQAETAEPRPVAKVGLPEENEGFQPLFDGKTLNGWEGNFKFFRVEDGAIVAGSLKEPIPNNEFLCTEAEYGDFELRFEAKLIGEGNNAGVQFRSQRIPNHHEVSGYQCDAGAAFDRPIWGALYDESRRNKMLAEAPREELVNWIKAEDWNDLRVIAQGDRIQIFLNGHQTVDYREEDRDIPRTGIIGLQIHSGPPTEAWYRNIRIKKLD
jgi:hypothetical protein